MARSKAPALATIFSAGVATKHPSKVSRAAETSLSIAVKGSGVLVVALPAAEDSLEFPAAPLEPLPLTVVGKSSGSSGQPKSSLVLP